MRGYLFANHHHVGITRTRSLDGESCGIKDNLHTLDSVGQVAVGALRNVDTGTLTQLVEEDENLLQQTLHITERLLPADVQQALLITVIDRRQLTAVDHHGTVRLLVAVAEHKRAVARVYPA